MYKESKICGWVEDGERCRHPAMFKKFYCETHHSRVYMTLLPEMADYLIEQEISEIFNDTD